MPLHPTAVIGPVYAVSERGLAADVLMSRALGLAPLPVCTQIVVASDGRVTDVTAVPVDTVEAQLEHLLAGPALSGVKIGGLASEKCAITVLDAVETLGIPAVLDFTASGPSGETVLDARGIDAIADRLSAVTLVTLSKADAELVTNTTIESLDDAQVAAQRLHHRGAKAVVIRCGALPYRFYDAADDPASGDGEPMFADLFYDGEDFALFEAPLLDADPPGASSALSLAVLARLIDGDDLVTALQSAKVTATEAVRQSVRLDGFADRLGGLAPFRTTADVDQG